MFGVESKAARRWQIESCDGEDGSSAESLRVGEKNSVRNRSESRFEDPHNLLKRGSIASRKASPIRLNVKTAIIMTTPGTTDIKG